MRERPNPQKRKIRTVGVMQKSRLKGNGRSETYKEGSDVLHIPEIRRHQINWKINIKKDVEPKGIFYRIFDQHIYNNGGLK